MYAFTLELELPRNHSTFSEENWAEHLRQHYWHRLSQKYEVTVTKNPTSNYFVSFEHKDENFNWCFSVHHDFKLKSLRLELPDIVLPDQPRGRRVNADGQYLVHGLDGAAMHCELFASLRERKVAVKMHIGDDYELDAYRQALWRVVFDLQKMSAMTRWLERLSQAHDKGNTGMFRRAHRELVKGIQNVRWYTK